MADAGTGRAKDDGGNGQTQSAPQPVIVTPEQLEEQGFQGPTLLDYLMSDKGHEVATHVLGMFQSLQKATIESGAEQSKRLLEHQHQTWNRWMVVTCIIVVTSIVACASLVWIGKMDGAVLAGLIGTMVGYAFGRKNG